MISDDIAAALTVLFFFLVLYLANRSIGPVVWVLGGICLAAVVVDAGVRQG